MIVWTIFAIFAIAYGLVIKRKINESKKEQILHKLKNG